MLRLRASPRNVGDTLVEIPRFHRRRGRRNGPGWLRCMLVVFDAVRGRGVLATFLSKTKTKRTSGDARPFLNLGQPLRRESVAGYGSSLGHARSVLKVILQNLGCQCRHDLGAWGLHGTDDFSATHNFGGGESGDLNGQDQVDFKLHVRLKVFFGMKQHAGAADVSRGAFTPALFAHRTIAQGEVKVEALRAERRELLSRSRSRSL